PLPPAPRSSLFPYTTLFRSEKDAHSGFSLLTTAAVFCVIIVGFAILYPIISSESQGEIHLGQTLQKPVLLGGTWEYPLGTDTLGDRKSTRLNSSHVSISYAV